MTDFETRSDRIIYGANFIIGLYIDDKWGGATWKAAAKRQIELLQEELNGEPEEEENPLLAVKQQINDQG